VVSQRLRFRPDLNIRVPECEILMATHAVKNFIRNRDFFKIISSLETGAEHGMWSFQRYRSWVDNRTNWYIPGQTPEAPETESLEAPPPAPPAPGIRDTVKSTKPERKLGLALPGRLPRESADSRIEIEPVESDFGKILKRPGEQ